VLNLLGLMAAGAIAAAPPPAQPMIQRDGPAGVEAAFDTSRFKCANGKELVVQFSTGESDFFAIVDAGDGPHLLKVLPFKGEIPKVTWSDGQRTLEWNVGVQLMFMDGPRHLDCSRGETHEH